MTTIRLTVNFESGDLAIYDMPVVDALNFLWSNVERGRVDNITIVSSVFMDDPAPQDAK